MPERTYGPLQPLDVRIEGDIYGGVVMEITTAAGKPVVRIPMTQDQATMLTRGMIRLTTADVDIPFRGGHTLSRVSHRLQVYDGIARKHR